MGRNPTHQCFYCDAVVDKKNLEWDHFPIPRAVRGGTKVPSCITCHSMKDRFLLENWSEESKRAFCIEMTEGYNLRPLWRFLSRESRILIAKVLAVVLVSKSLNDLETNEDVLSAFTHALNQTERDTNSKITSVRMKEARSQGKLVGSVPYGFSLNTDRSTLTPVKHEQDNILKMCHLRRGGMSYRAIAQELKRQRVCTKNGSLTWSAKVIREIICRAEESL